MSYSTCIHGGMCTGCMECEEEPKGYWNKFGEWVEYDDEDDDDYVYEEEDDEEEE